jgi:hypothetical protein
VRLISERSKLAAAAVKNLIPSHTLLNVSSLLLELLLLLRGKQRKERKVKKREAMKVHNSCAF